MRVIAFLFIMVFCSCKRTKEVETLLSEFTIAGYEFEVIEYKTIKKKTGEVLESYIDTILVNLDCDLCAEICSDMEDSPDVRR